MLRPAGTGLGLLVVVGVVVLGGWTPVRGQVAGPFGMGSSRSGASAMVPYWTMDPVLRNDPRAMAWMFLSEQRARGGIGSGRLSGLTQAQPGLGERWRGRPVAEMPRASSIPGGGAASYFGRGPAATHRVASYYQRRDRYFSSNGHD